MNISRRTLLGSALAAPVIATMAPGLNVAFGAETGTPRDTLIVIFQRGAADWLQMLAPSGDADYIKARPNIRVMANAGIGLGTMKGTDIYLSASAPDLKTLYDAGQLAFVHAAGMPTNSRSHFDCQDMMEKAAVETESKQTAGWLARHLASTDVAPPILATLSASLSAPVSLQGNSQAIAIGNSTTFNVSGGDANVNLLRNLNTGTSRFEAKARETLNAVSSIQLGLRTINTSQSNAAGYTGGALSTALRSLAQMIKMNVGVTTATVDFGSWDMHNSMVTEFATRTTEFSRAIAAFWKDMADYQSRITIVTMTEFGRRLQENASLGTDHGSASGMLVLGGNVNGGKLYGTWPGLAAGTLTRGDLAVTTDYRQVLSEILVTRHAEKNLAAVFPTVKYAPLGLIKTA